MGACKNLIINDSVPAWALCGGLFKLPQRTVSAFNEWHHCEYPINGCWRCDYRLSLCLLRRSGEIYDPAQLLNEQIDRFVFDIVRCILECLPCTIVLRPALSQTFSLCCFVEVRHSWAWRAFVAYFAKRRTHMEDLLGSMWTAILPSCYYQSVSAGTSWTFRTCVFARTDAGKKKSSSLVFLNDKTFRTFPQFGL